MEFPLISLFPITKVIAWISGIYALSVITIALVLSASDIVALQTAVKGIAVLNLLLFFMAAAGWKFLWKWCPILNDWVFPDLNGKWMVEIHWNWDSKSGQKVATAFVKQSLLKFSIELKSDESESETLIVSPYKDAHSSRPGLYYIYRNISIAGAAKEQDPHIGAAILKVDQESKELLHGNYFTDRSTNGQFTLRRAGED